MKTYEIIIDGDAIDLYENKSIGLAITAAISDANDLTARKASNVKTIKVPATGPNKIKFGHPEDINSVVNISQSAKPRAVISADGTKIFSGYAKINGSTDISGKKITEYELQFVGDNGDWVSRLNGKKIEDIDYSDQNHTRDYATIMASETVVAGREYVYDLIDRGAFSGQIYQYSTHSVCVRDRFPALSFSSIVNRIFKGIGYKIKSDFLDQPKFQSLYFPFINDKPAIDPHFADNLNCDILCNGSGQYIAAGATDKLVYNPVISVYSFDILLNPSGAWGSSHPSEYFCRADGKYTIQGRLSGTAFSSGVVIAGDGHVFLNIMKCNRFGDGIARSIYFQDHASTTTMQTFGYEPYSFFGTYMPATGNYEWGTFDLEFGDELFYQITTLNCSAYVTVVSFAIPLITDISNVGEGQLWDFNLNLPKNILQLNFIQSLKDCFNLYFTADTDARIVYCEPRDEFYDGEVEDWSKLLDRSKDVKTIFTGSNLSRTIRYKYKSDSSDKVLSQWEIDNVVGFGSDDAPITNVFAKDAVQVIENTLFAPTWMHTSEQIGLFSTLIPLMWTDLALPPQSTKFAPRILIYRGIKTLPATDQWKFNPIGTTDWQAANLTVGQRSTYPSFVFYDDSEPNDNNLMYCDRVYSSGLFQLHFRNGQSIMDDGRQYQAYMNVNDLYMSNLDFRKQKYIEEQGNGAYFILDRITDFKSEDQKSTDCLFVKVTRKVAIKKLQYVVLRGLGLAVPSPLPILPMMRASISASPGGGIEISGREMLRRNSVGRLQQGAGNVYTEVNGVITPVFFNDSRGNINEVIIE